ncbi:MAG: DUF4105 domain-containing protein [Flavobacterium sp.]|jgi:hypothetical protein|nr:DUF4105 domain-containing protein [Flavobacterium sp.]|tara:strand:- start:10361 stop:11530 length:1170 start_codon:yes stop_codon:yes gene_type:complete
MRKIHFYIVLLFIISQNIQSQSHELSVYSEISIVTVGPGNLLFEAFGHSAIRVKDPVLRMDAIYNYGLFDFNQPNFKLNFTKGKLLYKLGKRPFQNFVDGYNYQKRWMKNQVLNLSQLEKQKMYQLLEENALPQNADYLYDPYFNNCATKLRDVTKEILGNKVQFPSSYSEKKHTLRQLMNIEIPWNTWGNFGINLALGNTLDQEITAQQYMYLPDYLYQGFKNAQKIENNIALPLVKKEQLILNFEEKKIQPKWYNPFFIFSLLLLLTIVVTYRDQKTNKRSKWLDFILFFVTGLIGVIICFLWFLTDHSTTPNNFNFLWAFICNLFVAFVLLKNKLPRWLSKYTKLYLLLLSITGIVWLFDIQLFSIAILPVLAMLFIRVFYLKNLI